MPESESDPVGGRPGAAVAFISGIYEHDLTQGPACAISCGAGTIFRNYFVEVDGQFGQSADRQLDMLADVATDLGNPAGRFWSIFLTMLGGGAFGNRSEWIVDALAAVLEHWRHVGLDVRMVSHRRSNPAIARLVRA